MTDIIVKIMTEVLSILGIATKEIGQSRASELIVYINRHYRPIVFSAKYLKKVAGRTDIEDALARLDRLTEEEARMAAAQCLKATHVVHDGVICVDNHIQQVDDRVQGVGSDVQQIDMHVQQVDDKVQGVDSKVQGVGDKVQQVADDIDHQKRSLSNYLI